MLDTFSENVKLKVADGQEPKIEAKTIYQPQKNLGHFKSPSGTYKTQIDEILKKDVKNDVIAKARFTCNESQLFYDLFWHTAKEYTLAQSFFSDIQLQKIKTKLITLFLICCYNRNTA